jgi:hypothetical protein
MIVDVDEAGSEDQALGVDNFFIGKGLEIGGDGGDAIAGDTDIEFAEWGASAIGNLGVDDQDVLR